MFSRKIISNVFNITNTGYKRKSYNVKINSNSNPTFKKLLLTLYKSAHPDTMRGQHPKEASINDTSWQILNDIITTIKKVNTYPPKGQQTIPFYVKKDDKLLKIDLILNTPGGDCRKVLQKSFHSFFVTSGFLKKYEKFHWGTEYFPNEAGQVLDNKDGFHESSKEEEEEYR